MNGTQRKHKNEIFFQNELVNHRNIQLELGPRSITIRIEMFAGVLTERVFNGECCYIHLLAFLKQIGCADDLEAKISLR